MSTDYETELPARMRTLPRDKHGRPVPWFVERVDGEFDFRVMSADHLRQAVRYRLRWVCGKPMSAWSAFVLGPM